MFGDYFYNQSLRKMTIAFGQIFNNIQIRRKDSSGNTVQSIRVPLGYGPKEKFLTRLDQQPSLDNREFAVTLPRLGFEISGIQYDPTRKLTRVQKFKRVKTGKTGKIMDFNYMPVPYNISFNLFSFTATAEGGLQIIEQILPYFQPAYNVTVELVEALQEKRDIPVILENVTFQDDYEGDFTNRRVLLYTLRFTAKTYLFGPVSSATKDIIKKATISYLTGTDTSNATREVSYSVEPRAIKNYTGNAATTLAEDITKAKTAFNVADASGLTANTYVDLNGEEIFITKITGNRINVKRGQDGTNITDHLTGEEIFIIDAQDSSLIEIGDDFGFSGGF